MYDPTTDSFLDVRRPILLDLFCGAGGAAMGYYRAGFRTIVGVDIAPQPHYPFIFVQADALEYVQEFGRWFDAIHASPPCQCYTALKVVWNHRSDHPDLVVPVRERLKASARPYIIENVPGAPLQDPIQVCGTYFSLGVQVSDGWRQLRRHRLFESPLSLLPTSCHHAKGVIGIYGDHARDRRRKNGQAGIDFAAKTIGIYGAVPHGRGGGKNFSHSDKLELGRAAMQMPWAGKWKELCEAIPPAYTEYLGRQLLAHLGVA